MSTGPAAAIATITITNAAQLTALLHLAPSALPMGAFSYSQGLEAAVDVRHVADETSATAWIAKGLDVLAACEAPLQLLQFTDWQADHLDAVAGRDAWFLATRETRELQLETPQIDQSLNRFIQQLEWGDAALRSALAVRAFAMFPAVFAAAAAALDADPRDGVTVYCFAWMRNQVAATVKAVPLGQATG